MIKGKKILSYERLRNIKGYIEERKSLVPLWVSRKQVQTLEMMGVEIPQPTLILGEMH